MKFLQVPGVHWAELMIRNVYDKIWTIGPLVELPLKNCNILPVAVADTPISTTGRVAEMSQQIVATKIEKSIED